MLQSLAKELASVLRFIFEQSLLTGDLPTDWTRANVAQVFKKGSKLQAVNYRPVSLTCITCKLFEHIICRHVLGHLEQHKILTELQHGFRSGRLCETQLITTFQDIAESYDKKGSQIDIAVLDFSKAFDTVPHDGLLSKLKHYGIDKNIWQWISNFLKNRKQCVVVDGISSSPVDVYSRVPQGIVLGPILFLLHINNLPSIVSSKVRLFADDCLIYKQIKNNNDQIELQRHLNLLESWGAKWGMHMSIDIAVLDFSKAFDTVPHDGLLSKLKHYGIDKNIWQWISNFLKNRKQCVVVDGISSSPVDVYSRVPQGIVLGPILFLLHINNLPSIVSSKVRLFADDCLIYKQIKNNNDQIELQRHLNLLESWGAKWGMRFNPAKCNIMRVSRKRSPFLHSYTLSGQVLGEVEDTKYLEVTLSNNLDWSKHITTTTTKANARFSFIKRNLKDCPKTLKELAYFSLVRSFTDYCSTVWDPHQKYNHDKLEMVQRRARVPGGKTTTNLGTLG